MVKPFVKWVGGKRQLLPEIMRRVPRRALASGEWAYAEPFVGGGAVLLAVLEAFPAIPQAAANDLNPRLVAAWRAVQSQPEALIAALQALADAYLPLAEPARRAFYLAQRARLNAEAPAGVGQCARLLFLNRTGFNGLYRENARGAFNVPFGRAANPLICDAPTIRADAALLRRARVTFLCGDFAAVPDALPEGRRAFFYLDPPYRPLSQTSSFNAYVRTPFDDGAQRRLAEFCRALDRAGHRFLLSNSAPGDGFFERLYAGFRIERVLARRAVNANPAKRGPLHELLVSNYDPEDAP